MADDDEAQQDEVKKPRFQLGPKARWGLIGGLALLLLVAAIIGTLSLLGVIGGGEEDASAASAEPAAVSDQPPVDATRTKAPAMYFPVKPAFVVNFQTGGRTRYLQVEVSLLTRDPETFSALQTHLPLIKNRLVLLFSGEVFAELQTNEGRELLRQKALAAVQEILLQEVGSEGVEQVLFTDFVMQ